MGVSKSVVYYQITLSRCSPHFRYTVLLPLFATSALTLATFFIVVQKQSKNSLNSLPIMILLANIILQCIYGWTLIKQLQPGPGRTPAVGKCCIYLSCKHSCICSLSVRWTLLSYMFVPHNSYYVQ
jgi:hypothetical protein